MERPRILKVRTGYNPNSSSVGIPAEAFLVALWFPLGILVNLILGLVGATILYRNRECGYDPSSSARSSRLQSRRRLSS